MLLAKRTPILFSITVSWVLILTFTYACGPSTTADRPVPNELPLNATTRLLKLATTMQTLQGISYTFSGNGTVTSSGTDVPVTLKGDGKGNPPAKADQLSLTVTATGLGDLKTESIQVDGKCYNRSSGLGVTDTSWKEDPNCNSGTTTPPTQLANQVKNPQDKGPATVNGHKVEHLTVEYDPTKAPSSGTPSTTTFDGPIDLYIGISDNYLYETKFKIKSTSDNSSLTFDVLFDQFNVPVVIQAPAL